MESIIGLLQWMRKWSNVATTTTHYPPPSSVRD
ncbi:MAG: hypothetical protein M3299_03145 [Thermoproteota archaeon]|nr:hypothetical protein [Thermoproteota archaeon]